jgi:hypothetical protein
LLLLSAEKGNFNQVFDACSRKKKELSNNGIPLQDENPMKR